MQQGELRNVDEEASAWPPELEARYLETGLWTGRTLAERLRSAAAAAPDAPAVVDGSMRLSHAQLWHYADGTAARLARLGLRAGDRIVIQLPNCWEFVALTLACFRLGVLPVMALPAHRRHELSYLIDHVGARAMVVPGVLKGFDHQAMAHQIAARSVTLEHVLVAGDDLRPGSVSLRDICQADDVPAGAGLEIDRQDASATALFLLSGGTTGTPKLIPRTHNDYGCTMDHAIMACRFDSSTVYLATMPVGHNFTLGGPGVLGTLLAGGTVVLGTSPEPTVVFPLIERERVTVTAVVPAVAQRWLDFQLAGHLNDISSLQVLQVGGAHLPEPIAEQITPTLGCVVQQGYGMAEGLICITRPDDPAEVLNTTQGRPVCPGDEVRLADSEGRPVPPGEPGIVHTRGPCTIRSYYRAPEHNAVAFDSEGWYVTGDIARIRPDGNLVVEGRVKDMINRGGEKISAEEVEELAHRVAGVSLAAAVAMPDPLLGERICLYAVPRAGVDLSLSEIVRTMKDLGVAAYKLPERLIVIDALPLTAVGKIDKQALRADLERRLAQNAG
ncbi:MAG: AMP-binding protein [Jatrophihabitantaceae bacterium]